MLCTGNDFGRIIIVSSIVLGFVVTFAFLQNSSSQTGVVNPFTDTSAIIENVTKSTLDAKYYVTLKYSQETLKKGEPAFFMVDLFSNSDGKQQRMRHVDCDFIISRDGNEVFRLSVKYGEPFFHSINGVMLASFPFNEVGVYTISIEIEGVYFIPINPVFANFSGSVTQTSDGNLKINFA